MICTFASDMENPKKQIPQSIIAGGLVIAAIYIFSAFGIGVAIPTDQISTGSGLMDSFKLLTGSTGGWFIISMAFCLLTLFGNMISWSLGVNNTVCYAAENGDMPKVFAKRSKKWHAYWCGNYEWYRCFYRRRHRPNFTKSRFILGIFLTEPSNVPTIVCPCVSCVL